MQENKQNARKIEINRFDSFGEKRYKIYDVPASGTGQVFTVAENFTSIPEAREYIRNCGGVKKLLTTYQRVV